MTAQVTPRLTDAGRPALAHHVRLVLDAARDRYVLLSPETVVVLNATSADILRLCDGRRTVGEIVADLRCRYRGVAEPEVSAFLARMAVRRWVEVTDG